MHCLRISFRLGIAVLIVFGLSACTRIRVRPPDYVETGIASWYGPGFHGKSTSNREIYDMYDMTAAHPSLPFETHLLVTNLNNNRFVIVRINDRGPFVKGRIIDLSFAAARILDMVGPGTARVRIEVIPDLSPPTEPLRFSVQVGSFVRKSNAKDSLRRLKTRYPEAYTSSFRKGNREYHRVRIRAQSRKDAIRLAHRLRSDGFVVLILEEW